MPFFVHFSVVAGPKAWNTIALFTNGAAMINAHSLPARIVANVFIWALLLYGIFYLIAFRDYVMSFVIVFLVTGEASSSNNVDISLTLISARSPAVLDQSSLASDNICLHNPWHPNRPDVPSCCPTFPG